MMKVGKLNPYQENQKLIQGDNFNDAEIFK